MEDDELNKPLISEIDGEKIDLENYGDKLSSTRRKLNIAVALLSIFLSNTGFALVAPSLWIYLQKVNGSEFFLGVVTASYSVGQIIGAPLLGFWSNKRTHKESIAASLVILFIGCIGYSYSFNKYGILFCRFLQGLGSGNSAVLQSFVASISTNENRTAYLANLNMVGTIGYIVGPAIGALLSFVNFKVGNAIVASYNSTGYFFGVFTFINFILVVTVFKENRKSTEIEDKKTETISEKKVSNSKSFYLVLFMLIIIFFDLFNELSVYDTLATPITLKYYNWGVLYNSILWAGISSISVGIIVIVGWKSETPLWRFLFGTGLISWGFPISQVVLIATYSKLLGNQKQGVYMGWLTAGGALARCIAPIWSTNVFDKVGIDLVFIITGILLLIGEIVLICLHLSKKLQNEIEQANIRSKLIN